MGGGLLQLVAYGAQDVYLTGNPQITFFKVVYRRHTNFAMESIEQSFNGNNNFGSSVSVLITRNGDLINRVYFNGKVKNTSTASTEGVISGVTLGSGGTGTYVVNEILNIDGGNGGTVKVTGVTEGAISALELNEGGYGYTSGETYSLSGSVGGSGATVSVVASHLGVQLVPYFGQKLLKTIELEIGGQKIDKHYSEWLYIWNELSMPVGKKEGYEKMVGATRNSDGVVESTVLSADKKYEVYVPLEFWFCRNVGLALPLIALQYHEVKININYASKADIVVNSTDSNKIEMTDVSMWVDYIFLDTDERRRFAQLSHEYLIEQLQFTGSDTISLSTDPNTMKSSRMTFNHPCKELIWTVRSDADSAVSEKWNRYTDDSYENHVMRAKIQLNGNDRMTERDGTYFSRVQPYQHHENTPTNWHGGINVYSFALKPEEHQPSGTLNMSRIDTAVLSVSSRVSGSLSIYAVNYNVLRIMSGMGGLAYSN